MIRHRAVLATLLLSLSLLATPGCTTSTTPPAGTTGGTGKSNSAGLPATTSNGEASLAEAAATVRPGWDDYPDVPKYEVMTEVDGIKIPRLKTSGETLSATGKIVADAGNPRAKGPAGQPVDGDWITVRFNSEPKVLNPITSSDAVQTYIMQYVNEGLARQNPETFEWEPHIASKWVVEDSVKLSADYPGKERRVGLDGQPAATSVEIDYEAPALPTDGGKPTPPPTVKLTASNKDGQPLGGVWVGVFPVGRIAGASITGYHFWSDSAGHVEVGGFPTGKYTVKVGAEVYGQSQSQPDGSLVVTAASAENPLNDELKSAASQSLALKPGEWTDIQAQTYYTYTLRDDVTWSDGTPFTSQDVEFAYALLNSSFVDGDHIRTYYAALIECRALGQHTVRMRYQQQYFKAPEFTYGVSAFGPPFHLFEKLVREDKDRQLTFETLTPEQELAQKKLSVTGQEFGKFFNNDDRYNRSPIGTGPYIVDKWERGDRVELKRNPNYWRKELAGHLDRIVIKFIPDQVTAMQALRSGVVDFFYDMTAEQFYEDLADESADWFQGKFAKAAWYVPIYSYFGWNELKPQFQDRRVRLALTMLLDREAFLKTKLHGSGVLVSGTQYYFGPGYDHEVAPIGYDPEAARELLSSAGWIDTDNDGILDKNGVKFQITLELAKGKKVTEELCEVLQKNAKQVGIDIQVRTLEWASFIDRLRAREIEAMTLRWTMPPESDPFQIWHSSEAGKHKRGSNAISFANAEADQLIEMLRVTLDEQKRKRIHQSFHRLIDSEQPYTFLWIPKDLAVYHQRFRNVKWYRLRPGFDLSEWYVPKDEQVHK